MKFKKKNFNETIKLQKFVNQIQRRIQDPHNIQGKNLPDMSPWLKAVIKASVIKSTIAVVARVLVGLRGSL